MRRITVCGAGYVGLVTAAALASFGHDVVCYDCDQARIALLQEGELPIFEAELASLIGRHMQAGRLRFTAEDSQALGGREIIFIAVGTPSDVDGNLDVSAVRTIAAQIADHVRDPVLVVNKSTVPVETADLVHAIMVERARPGTRIDVASNPEFLREGTALADFLHPDRIVIGVESAHAESLLRELYEPIHAPLVVTDRRTAEMIKYASNAFLAMKVSYANEIASLCEAVGIDSRAVLAGAGADERIGSAFLGPGLGYGGSCLPKDVAAMQHLARAHGTATPLLDATVEVNAARVAGLVEKLKAELGNLRGKRIAVLGIAFKGGTDDTRNSPALALIETLHTHHHANVIAYDPAAALPAALASAVRASDPYAACAGADAVVIATDWPQFAVLDWEKIARDMPVPRLFDARTIVSLPVLRSAGFFR